MAPKTPNLRNKRTASPGLNSRTFILTLTAKLIVIRKITHTVKTGLIKWVWFSRPMSHACNWTFTSKDGTCSYIIVQFQRIFSYLYTIQPIVQLSCIRNRTAKYRISAAMQSLNILSINMEWTRYAVRQRNGRSTTENRTTWYGHKMDFEI